MLILSAGQQPYEPSTGYEDRPTHDMIDRPEQATTAIAATQLTRAADLLDLLDGFVRTGNGVADRLRYHLDTTTADHPDRPGYDANLVIDLVGLATHAPPATVTPGHRVSSFAEQH